VTAPVPRASELEPSLPHGVDAVLARGLAKRPEDRPESAGELVAALRAAFREEATSTVAVGPAPAPMARGRRRRAAFLALGAVALLVAGIAGAALAAAMSDNDVAPRVRTQVRTVVRTETTQGTPETTTVTVETPAPPAPPPAPDDQGDGEADGADLNDEAFRLMQEGDFAGALALLEQAVADLTGQDSLAEAYAAYNLAFTRFALGRCDGVLDLLDRSEQVQGKRSEIDRLRKDVRRACGA
jgi:hypothetical protein